MQRQSHYVTKLVWGAKCSSIRGARSFFEQSLWSSSDAHRLSFFLVDQLLMEGPIFCHDVFKCQCLCRKSFSVWLWRFGRQETSTANLEVGFLRMVSYD